MKSLMQRLESEYATVFENLVAQKDYYWDLKQEGNSERIERYNNYMRFSGYVDALGDCGIINERERKSLRLWLKNKNY